MDQQKWNEWVAERPPAVQALCRKLPPDRVYRMKSTGHRVRLYSYNEGTDAVTLTVLVLRSDNPHIWFERRVFGIDPADLEVAPD